MAEAADDKLSEGKLDLVPMIDCIMLLLLFFILTTKFSSEEKSISSLLPTDKGQSAARPDVVKPPEQLNICIYPAGMERGKQPSEYLQQLHEIQVPGQVIGMAYLRIGKSEPMEIVGKDLKAKAGAQIEQIVGQIHQYISDNLAKVETGNPADRKDQEAVIINCFSGLSWKYAIIAYDAVRAYEGKVSGRVLTGDPTKDFDQAREVDFAPPRIRNYSTDELGNELFEIVNMR
jgi:hypothetical protein